MAAGLGFKTFNTGEVLSASDTNGYLMQGVWVFASAAARTSAVTSPQEGNVSFLKDTNSLEIYDGAAWVAYGAGDITGVTAGTGISGGGTAGTVTITNSMATAIDAKGDLIVGTAADTFDRLAVGGTNGHVLTVDSSTSTGVKWAAAATGSTDYVMISRSTFSNQTSVSIDSVFSSTYKSYQLVFEELDGSGELRLTFLYSGTEQTTGYYGNRLSTMYNTSTLTNTATNNGSYAVLTGTIGANYKGVYDIIPNASGATWDMVITGSGCDTSDPRPNWAVYAELTARAYTGIKFLGSTANISGTVTVYGRK